MNKRFSKEKFIEDLKKYRTEKHISQTILAEKIEFTI
jgi:DNA-binding XRE family transcriptional regulator